MPKPVYKFIPSRLDGSQSDVEDVDMGHLVYLSIDIPHDDGQIDRISGFVRPSVSALVKAAPKLLCALRKIRDEHRILGDALLIAWVNEIITAAEGQS